MYELTESQKQALDVALSGENLFLTGVAGTGKSYLTKIIYEELTKQGKKVALCASTGTAALNLTENVGVQASTAHSLLGISLGKDKVIELDGDNAYKFFVLRDKLNALARFDTILFDEVSMLRLDSFGRAMLTLNKAEVIGKKKIQRIVVGDMLQLPPVITKADREGLSRFYNPNEMYPFDFTPYQRDHFDLDNPKSYTIWAQQNFVPVELKEIVRQEDEEFSSALSRIRLGDATALKLINESATICNEVPDNIPRLCPLVKDVDAINKQKLAELINNGAPAMYFDAETSGIVKDKDWKNIPEPDVMILAPGARIRITVNAPQGTPERYDGQTKYINGTLGTFLGMDDDCLLIELDDGSRIHLMRVEREVFGPWYTKTDLDGEEIVTRDVVGVVKVFPVILAWAMTIHRAQGFTFDKMFLSPSKIFSNGQLYVALSRLTNKEGLYLDSYIYPDKVKCDQRVKLFLDKYLA